MNKHKVEMAFELAGERLTLSYGEKTGMFLVALGRRGGGKVCTLGTHCERAVAVLMFNWEAKAMQKKWEDEP